MTEERPSTEVYAQKTVPAGSNTEEGGSKVRENILFTDYCILYIEVTFQEYIVEPLTPKGSNKVIESLESG